MGSVEGEYRPRNRPKLGVRARRSEEIVNGAMRGENKKRDGENAQAAVEEVVCCLCRKLHKLVGRGGINLITVISIRLSSLRTRAQYEPLQ